LDGRKKGQTVWRDGGALSSKWKGGGSSIFAQARIEEEAWVHEPAKIFIKKRRKEI